VAFPGSSGRRFLARLQAQVDEIQFESMQVEPLLGFTELYLGVRREGDAVDARVGVHEEELVAERPELVRVRLTREVGL
jgi:hypothetical protein